MDLLQNNKRSTPLQLPVYLIQASRVLLLLYIFTMPFVSAFAFSGTISLPLIFGVVLFLLMLLNTLRTLKLPPGFVGYDLLLIIFFILQCIFSYLINGFGIPKSLNHTIAYSTSFLLFFITIKYTFCIHSLEKDFLRKIFFMITVVVIINILYVNVEFISENAFGIDLNNFIPRPSAGEMLYKAGVVSLFHRARGFASESGGYTSMIELFFPIAIYYMYFSGWCRWNRVKKGAIIFFTITSLIFAASTATFIIIPACFFLAGIVHFKRLMKFLQSNFKKVILVTFIVTLVSWLLNYFFSIVFLIYLSITDKMDSSSYDEREGKMNFFFEEFAKLPFIEKFVGAGPAGFHVLGFDESNSIISLYYNTIFEIGIIGFIILALFLIYYLVKAVSLKGSLGFFLLVSTLGGAMHYYISNSYWIPWYWFILALVSYVSAHQKNNTAN